MPQHRRAGSSRLLENGDSAVMLQELNLVPRPDPEAIAQFLGQRYLSLGTQNGHRWSLARMTKNTMSFTSCQKVKIVGLVPLAIARCRSDLQTYARCQAEKPRARRLVGLRPHFWDAKPLKSRMGGAILSSLSLS